MLNNYINCKNLLNYIIYNFLDLLTYLYLIYKYLVLYICNICININTIILIYFKNGKDLIH